MDQTSVQIGLLSNDTNAAGSSDSSYAKTDLVKRSKSLKLFSRGRKAVLEQYLANQEQIAKENETDVSKDKKGEEKGFKKNELWVDKMTRKQVNKTENDHSAEVANLELNGLRMTANANFHQVRQDISVAVVARIDQVATKTGAAIGKVVTQILKRWETTIRRCVFERKDEVDFLLLSQRECLNKPDGPNILSAIAR
ncbi:Similar to Probable translation initiation factor eIF-2B subunit epsilon; acc. no. P56287 [Pyronema omphalodes CBS 100304]|uniref:Similar to Probable translation initiation factor eIF-2B subunit epsilon acc. no. P56287 n=1 Tax=Pyronema omphalodes (strain CBS 100304) TaxID=1076935 RepID=U4L0E9_PYROM|nr:Similar to Probable translation initiation factor eIF-2B subunit epsilon; acc. no. P56287 [Pyronema omphalodes CBS 100304]